MEYLFRLVSGRLRTGQCVNVFVAVVCGTLGAACGGDIDRKSNASNVDAATGGVLPIVPSAADTGVPGVGPDANGSGDGSNGEGGVLYGAGNLIVNPSCEDGTYGWTTLASGSSLIASSTTYVHTGDTASCRDYDRMDEAAPPSLVSYDGPVQDITSVVVPGHSYTVSAWALWAPPLLPDAGSGDASTGSSDGAAGSDGSTAIEPQNVYITAREVCSQNGSENVMYDRFATASDVPEATWTLVQDSTLLMVPTGCSGLDIELYVEGPDIGLDLYVDEVTVLFVQ